jgi:transcriptional regulator GlxA family with amidase domain
MTPSREFLAFVDRCQAAVGVAACDPAIASVLFDAPQLPNVTEQLVAEALLDRLRRGLATRRVPDPPLAAPASPRHAHLARRALLWIDQHHTEPATAARLAAAIGVSRCHLARVVKQQTRHGVRWHFGEARTRHAERLIRESELSLKEIAARAGFRSASDLSRQFHHHRGVAPSRLLQREGRVKSHG